MEHRETNRATFVEVFGSIKFDSKKSTQPADRWPQPGFAVNSSTHQGEELAEDHQKLVRSVN